MVPPRRRMRLDERERAVQSPSLEGAEVVSNREEVNFTCLEEAVCRLV